MFMKSSFCFLPASNCSKSQWILNKYGDIEEGDITEEGDIIEEGDITLHTLAGVRKHSCLCSSILIDRWDDNLVQPTYESTRRWQWLPMVLCTYQYQSQVRYIYLFVTYGVYNKK